MLSPDLTYLIISVSLASVLGYWSMDHRKAFRFGILGVAFGSWLLFTYSWKISFAAGYNRRDMLAFYMDMFKEAPSAIQTAIVAFPIVLIVARIITNAYIRLIRSKRKESHVAKKKRVMDYYGITMDDLNFW